MLRWRRLAEQRIFFPWERRSGRLRRFGLAGIRPLLLGLAVLSLVLWMGLRERRAAGQRQTRVTLRLTRAAVDAYLADHAPQHAPRTSGQQGGCPQTMAQLVEQTTLRKLPRDAWGRPLRLICPGRREGSRYELLSDGPDGVPGGLDRIE